jgi:hypothetical protein
LRAAAVLGLLAVLVFEAAGAASQRSPRNVCDVAVIDPDGLPVPGLGLQDFVVMVDGSPAALSGVTRASSELAIVLVADATTSQPLRRYEIINALGRHWLPSLRPRDQVRIGTIGDPLTLTPWLPIDQAAALAIARPIIERAATEPSPLWDATAAAIDVLATMPGAKVVVLLSDGRANANKVGLDDVAERALGADVAISTVSEGADREIPQAAADAAARLRSDASLQWLADQTGGLFLPDGVARRQISVRKDPFAYVREMVQTPNAPGLLLVRGTSSLRERYRLTFDWPADGRWHTLDVAVSKPGVTLRVRRRFLASR